MRQTTVQTAELEVAVSETGPTDGFPIILQHGWPDGPRSFARVADTLAEAGYRCVMPTLRGHGETRFRSPDIFRGGQVVALARDIQGVADCLGITRFHLVGHDWGCRAAFAAAVLFPDRLRSIVPMSLGWQPASVAGPMSVRQAQAFWYQWWFATPAGAQALADRPTEVARRMWETWSPPRWFAETDWDETVAAFANPDWASVVTHYYRARYGLTDLNGACANDETAFAAANKIGVPCCLLHGASDTCTLPALSDDTDRYVDAAYERHLLDGVGHFPQREAPDQVARLILDWVNRIDQDGT